ncbi:MAG: hypothetical protein QOE55_7407, partial [Acidobacteriaceae bacterium]|nr:hypothetical protein [Acidobacteriaceae bacterium]
HQIVDLIASAQQVNEIANQAILILPNQLLQENDIPLAQTARNLLRVAVH